MYSVTIQFSGGTPALFIKANLLYVATSLFLLAGPSVANAQVRPADTKDPILMPAEAMTISDGCEEFISVTGDKTVVESKKISVVKREGLQYGIKFTRAANGVTGTIYSVGGELFQPGDELLVLTATRDKLMFAYQSVSDDHRAATFPLAETELKKWATADLETVFLKDNGKNQMLKYSVNEECKFQVKSTLNCLLQMVR
ncbi:MAG: hypothetical protein R2830_04620 [Saprospiraceae bacterium]